MATMQERAELHKTIWKIANDLRGSVDGWEFMAYVLGSIFYRFISENICDYIHQLMTEAGQPDFDYSKIDDAMAENIRQKMVEEKGYFILPSQLFQNVVARCEKDENLNETLSAIFRSTAVHFFPAPVANVVVLIPIRHKTTISFNSLFIFFIPSPHSVPRPRIEQET